MRPQDIIIGNYYRVKPNTRIGYAKPVKIYPPKELHKDKNYYIVKCEWTQVKDASFGFIKYFRPRDMVIGK